MLPILADACPFSNMKTCPCNMQRFFQLKKLKNLSEKFWYFLYCCSKHKLWVLITNESLEPLHRVPTIYVLSKNKKNILQKFSTQNFQFLQLKKNLYITRACFRNATYKNKYMCEYINLDLIQTINKFSKY